MSKTSGARRAPGDSALAPLATVVRLRPIRTLTIARDLAFRRRAMTVLAELGPTAFAVMAPEPPGELATFAAQQEVDVVVIDMTGSAPVLPQIVAALSEHAPHIGVVAVADDADGAGHSLNVLPKWSWATDLELAVQDAHRRGNPPKEDHADVRHQ